MRETAARIRDLEVVAGDRTTFINEDMAIHKLIYRATGNPHLEDVLIRYDNLATRIWCLVIDRLPDLAEHVREHALPARNHRGRRWRHGSHARARTRHQLRARHPKSALSRNISVGGVHRRSPAHRVAT